MKKLMMILLAMAVSTAAFGANVKSGQFGLNYQFSGGMNSWGAWWHVHDMIALAPSIGYDAEDDDAGRTESTMSFGLNVPIYLAQFNKLDLFVAPGFNYNSNKVDNNGVKTTTNSMTFGVGLGVQIALTEQLHAFGVHSFNYNDNDGPTSYGLSRTSVGAIFYFN